MDALFLLEDNSSTSATKRQYCCNVCHLPFAKKVARKRHRKAMHPPCGLCHRRFKGLEHLQSHQKETGHLYCSECDLRFGKYTIHRDHMRTVQHITHYHCCDCDRDYYSQQSLDNHCCDCDRVFRSSKSLDEHLKKHKAHLPRVNDLRVRTDMVRADQTVLHRCKKCNEEFPTKRALQKHRLKHKPQRHIPCPVGMACKKMFIAASGLLNHLESSHCCSGMTRAKMHELVFAYDKSHHITEIGATGLANSVVEESARYSHVTLASVTANRTSQPQHARSPSILASLGQLDLIGDESSASIDDDTANEWSILDGLPLQPALSGSDSEWSILGGVPLGPVISESGSERSLASPILTPSASNMSNLSLDRHPDTMPLQNLRCHRCPPSRKPFCNLVALQAHISSAAHSPKIFHCPLAFVPDGSLINKRKKERYFATLAGLAQHLESGACQGGAATFINAMNYIQDQLKSLGFESIRLLQD